MLIPRRQFLILFLQPKTPKTFPAGKCPAVWDKCEQGILKNQVKLPTCEEGSQVLVSAILNDDKMCVGSVFYAPYLTVLHMLEQSQSCFFDLFLQSFVQSKDTLLHFCQSKLKPS